jgi:hypothetical protein
MRMATAATPTAHVVPATAAPAPAGTNHVHRLAVDVM